MLFRSHDKPTDLASELRLLSVKELRTQCSQQGIRWANMIEKEDLVQALVQQEKIRKDRPFSPSGKIEPGHVADISGEILAQELEPGKNMVPLLLDVRMYQLYRDFTSYWIIHTCFIEQRSTRRGAVHVNSWQLN